MSFLSWRRTNPDQSEYIQVDISTSGPMVENLLVEIMQTIENRMGNIEEHTNAHFTPFFTSTVNSTWATILLAREHTFPGENIDWDSIIPNVELQEEETCTICINLDNELRKELPCGHRFHFSCLKSWLTRNPTCPICRADVLNGLSENSLRESREDQERIRINLREEQDRAFEESLAADRALRSPVAAEESSIPETLTQNVPTPPSTERNVQINDNSRNPRLIRLESALRRLNNNLA